MIRRCSLCACCVFLAAGSSIYAGDPADAVVRVFATVRDPDWLQPWNKQKPVELTGSGTVIEGKQILTNAHVVLYATEVYVQSRGEKKTAARVKVVAPGIDLALLSVADADGSFFASRSPLPRAKKLPAEKSLVGIHGYRTGANKPSITKSRVFRIDYVPYSPQSSGLQVQIDEIVEAGVSGGPVIAGREMVGLALSLGKGDKFGHVIPNEEIDAFLQDAGDGHYDGKPWLPGYFQGSQNDALRQKLGLRRGDQGLIVTRANDPLKQFDMVTRIGRYSVDNEGQVEVDGKLRVSFQYLVPRLAARDKVPVTVLRKGTPLTLELSVARPTDFLLRELNGKYPTYVLYGPLVFSAVSLESANQLFQLNPDPLSPVVQRRDDKLRFVGEELVAVTSVLPHPCLAGYPNPLGRIVKEINGMAVKNLRHLTELLRDGTDEFVTFELAGDPLALLVFERKDMARVTKEIRKKHSIPE